MNALEKLAEQAPELEFELPDGTPVVKLGLIVTLYYKEGYTAESKQRVMECFKRFYDEFGSHLKGQFHDRFKKLNAASFEKIRQQILESGPNEEVCWSLSSAATSGEAGDYGIATLNSPELHGDAMRSYLKLTLPWSFLSEVNGAEDFQQWLVFLCG